MPATEAQIRANQANALRSTGPKTPEGKAVSRGNALKHGLTGAGVALPIEDAADVQRRFDALMAEMNPSTELGRTLVRRIALLSVRLDRCVSHETASLSVRTRKALDDFEAPAGLDPSTVALRRAEAGAIALFDPSPEATLARKYESAAERGMYRALKELRQAEAVAQAARPEAVAQAARESLASFLPPAKFVDVIDDINADRARSAQKLVQPPAKPGASVPLAIGRAG